MPFLTSKPCDVTDADMTFKLRDTVITMPPCWYYIIYHEIVINASFLGLSATFLCAAPFPSAHRMMNHVIFRLMYSPLKKPARQKMEIQLKGAAAQSMLITAINPVHQTRIIDWFCTNVLCTPDCNKKIIKIQPFLLIPCDFSMQRTSTSSRQLLGDFEVRGGECVRRWREGISLEWLVLDVYWSIVQLLCTLDFLLFDVSVPPPPPLRLPASSSSRYGLVLFSTHLLSFRGSAVRLTKNAVAVPKPQLLLELCSMTSSRQASPFCWVASAPVDRMCFVLNCTITWGVTVLTWALDKASAPRDLGCGE